MIIIRIWQDEAEYWQWTAASDYQVHRGRADNLETATELLQVSIDELTIHARGQGG